MRKVCTHEGANEDGAHAEKNEKKRRWGRERESRKSQVERMMELDTTPFS